MATAISKEGNGGEYTIFKYSLAKYTGRTIFKFQHQGRTHCFVVNTLGKLTGFISGYDQESCKNMPLPEQFHFRCNEAGWARKWRGIFAITWCNTYTLYFEDREVLQIECPIPYLTKQRQSVEGSSAVPTQQQQQQQQRMIELPMQ